MRRRLGVAARRLTVDAGLSCPNRGGGRTGCLFCHPASYAGPSSDASRSVAEQVRRGLARKRDVSPVVVYFQAGSNTNGTAPVLDRLWRSALVDKRVAGIVVGTRPDLLPPEVVDALAALSRDTYLSVELGLQSIDDTVLARAGRGHDVATFDVAASTLVARGIDVGVHLIHGLPGDTKENFVAAAGRLSALGVAGVKIHHFHVVRGSGHEEPWRRGDIVVPSIEDHVSACADFVELLAPELSVMRFAGTAPDDLLLAPVGWPKGDGVARAVTAELARRCSWQGSRRTAATGRAEEAG